MYQFLPKTYYEKQKEARPIISSSIVTSYSQRQLQFRRICYGTRKNNLGEKLKSEPCSQPN